MMLEILKALADSSRLRLVAVLLQGEFTVQELTRILATGQSRISHHLKILTEAGLLTVKRQGTWSYYRANSANLFFAAILPALVPQLDLLPERSRDLAEVAAVLEERRRRSQEFFDRHARQWNDLAMALMPLPAYRHKLLDLVGEAAVVLEIGTGTGGLLQELAARASRVIGVDHSPEMLAEARRNLPVAGADKIDLRLGEMSHLPLPDSAVDVVIANMVLHHAASPPAVLAETRRVLRPGGLLLIADLARHERESAREQLADQWLGFEETELLGWLEEAGFRGVRSEQVQGREGEETVLLLQAVS